MTRRSQNARGVRARLAHVTGCEILFDNFREPDHRVERRSQFMADIGEKPRLRSARFLRPFLRLLQLRRSLDSAALQIGRQVGRRLFGRNKLAHVAVGGDGAPVGQTRNARPHHRPLGVRRSVSKMPPSRVVASERAMISAPLTPTP